MKDLSRRKYLKNSVLSIGSLFLVNKTTSASSCSLTPSQTEGPFYPVFEQFDKDSDLTRVAGRTLGARGEVVVLMGVVSDNNCRPVKNALVEIWQACDTGKYNHPGDPNPAELDPNFQYWGRTLTNDKGEYSFKTVRPGHYHATANWVRPAHIHLKVHRRGYEELTTQVYFSDDKYNKNDRILQSLSKEERESVIVNFKKKPFSNDLKYGKFDITVSSIS